MKTLNVKYIIILVTLIYSFAFAQNPVAVVIKTKGDVTITKADGKKAGKIKTGAKLYDGDKIVTGVKGIVAITFLDDKSLVRIRPNSSCTINAKKEENSIAKNVFVEVGTIFSKITKQKSKFKVSTPTSVASVKGTEYWTVQEFKGGTNYFCEYGIIEISNDEGSALVKAGETGAVSSSKSKPLVWKTKPGEKPEFDKDEQDVDSFEFEFKKTDGNSKDLKFKIQPKK
ncbi:MAG: FecR domain-containing protein [Calditrichaceae bacterium]|nr:FecR domain-containing protein [Calditrichaceae bacterium]MBN2707731.1 FecR domain-containing protein [Calditrichaceae bacterium]RQV96454.1 MAG: hypothetical protein EH224_04350 [Calditrichota bacterium]